jgi:hypothetical protein
MSRKDGKSPHESFCGKEAAYSQNLRIFGEVGIKLSKLYGLPEKLLNKGNHCLFLEYAEDHPNDTYRVLDLKNQSVMLTRYVRWLGKTHGEFLMVMNRKSSKIQSWRALTRRKFELKPHLQILKLLRKKGTPKVHHDHQEQGTHGRHGGSRNRLWRGAGRG